MLRSTAISGMMSPVRTAAPVSGSTTLEPRSSDIGCILAARVAGPCVQVRPLSLERISEKLKSNFAPLSLFLKPRISLKASTSVPSGSTTTWLPIVWLLAPGS